MRKVVTSSKATAVQIVSKTRGVRTIVEHVGSAHGEEQLAVLLAIARERISELAGRVPLDLDGLGATPPATAAPTVAGPRSRVLWEVLEAAHARLGFDTVGNDTFRKLALARVVGRRRKRTRCGCGTSSGFPVRRRVDGVAHPGPFRGAGLAVPARRRRIRACDPRWSAHGRALRLHHPLLRSRTGGQAPASG